MNTQTSILLTRRRVTVIFASLVALLLGWVLSRQVLKSPTSKLGMATSGSMEPAIPSPLIKFTCSRCKLSFASILSSYNESLPTPCLHCGGSDLKVETIGKVPDVQLRKLSETYSLKVGDIIAFREEGSSASEIKRIAGLPGNRVELKGGDLWIDNVRHQKDLPSFLSQAILVHAQGMKSDPTRWIDHEGTYSYHHAKPEPGNDHQWQMKDCPVTDEFWMNQGERLMGIPVSDLGMLFDFKIKARFEKLNCSLEIDSIVHHVDLERRQNRWNITHRIGEQVQASEDPKWLNAKEPNWFAVAVVDGRLIAGTDTNSYELFDLPSTEVDQNPKLSFRMFPDTESVRTVMVIRDLFYRRSNDHRDGRIQESSSSESSGYTVLGDNIAISDDSRHRFPKGVARSEIRFHVEPSSDPLHSLRRQAELYR